MRLTNALTRMCSDDGPKCSALARFPKWLNGRLHAVCDRTLGRDPVSALPQPGEPIRPESEPDDSLSPEAEPGEHALSLVDRMLSEGRYALLLRRQLIANLSDVQIEHARDALAAGMCVVPGGEVVIHCFVDQGDDDSPVARGESLRVDGYYLDRFPVTNAEYSRFVASGGYEQMAIWDREIWPALLDFADQTGKPGPRFWRNGHYPDGEGRHPVVGVSWYEAAAYARWIGKRLPTDAEWIKAASWPVAIPGQPLVARRFPWGDSMDRSRANLWGGPGGTVPVEEFPTGVSVGGAHQLIGNVWEWMAEDYLLEGDTEPQSSHSIMKIVRGGAFDTYLDSQATCEFQSGDLALARKHNIGFRCAISWDDLAPPPVPETEVAFDPVEPLFEETYS